MVFAVRPAIDGLQPLSGDLEGMPSSDAGKIQELRAAARRHAASASTFPWVVGYEQARAIREQIAPDSKTRLAVDRYIASTVRKAPDVSLQALGAGASHPHPHVVIGQNRPAASKRFTLSRAPGIISGTTHRCSWSPLLIPIASVWNVHSRLNC